MISWEQENQITNYLMSKRLSSELLIEVKDHFILQISHLMEYEKMNFHEAFFVAATSWQKELEMARADFLSFRKIARMEKGLIQSRFNMMMIRSGLLAVLFAVIFMLSDNIAFYIQVSVFLLFAFIILLALITKKISVREYHRAHFHPLVLRNIILGLVLFPIGCYFSKTFNFWEPSFNQIVIFYSLSIQIQLLYFRVKKVNVLI